MVNPNTSTANISVPLLDKSQGASHTRGLPRCVADLDWVGHGFVFDYPVLNFFFLFVRTVFCPEQCLFATLFLLVQICI